jgi:hypothetical protein
VNWAGTVYHGLPLDLLRFNPSPEGEYLAFLGRISPEKRPDRAIEIARRAQMRVRIAAKVDDADRHYFEQNIRPLLEDPLVEFIGEIGEQQKSDFLGNASALLFPVDWPEPFGLVMIEAMACGTPVIAYPHGSVLEIIDPGITGFIVRSIEEAVVALGKAQVLDRRAIRRRFEQRFSAARMARDYVALYRKLARTANARTQIAVPEIQCSPELALSSAAPTRGAGGVAARVRANILGVSKALRGSRRALRNQVTRTSAAAAICALIFSAAAPAATPHAQGAHHGCRGMHRQMHAAQMRMEMRRGSAASQPDRVAGGPAASTEPPPQPESPGALLVGKYCTQCHARPAPSLHLEHEWDGVTQRMRVHMGAFQAAGQSIQTPSASELSVILEYLREHSAAGSRP